MVAVPIMTPFADEDDKKFYEVANTAGAYLVTGNLKHFPTEARDHMLRTPAELLGIVEAGRGVNGFMKEWFW